MRSSLPKALHRIGGKPLVRHVYDLARDLESQDIAIVYGHGGSRIPETCADFHASWVEQTPQLGTGHAVQQAAHLFANDGVVLVLYGDVPLLRIQTMRSLLALLQPGNLALLTVEMANPQGYGRIVRDTCGNVVRIVEDGDAMTAERAIREVNTGILACGGGTLKSWLSRLSNDNAQGEYYLTDVIGMAVADGLDVAVCKAADETEVQGINTRQQLAGAERIFQRRQAEALMERGVTLLDPARFDLRGEVVATGRDVEIDVNVVFEGRIELGDRVRIGPNVYLKDCCIGHDAEVLAHSSLDQADVGAFSRIGPFARIRPDTRIEDHVHIGNFVEIKKSVVASRSKINHLSYVGDTLVGQDVNIGAGTITCNYDGANKHQTVIEDGAFIGSDTQLVAPVTVARNATIGAGSTITKDAPEDTLTLSRAKQVSVQGWRRPTKKGY